MLQAFENENITASAFWKWDYQDADTASFNLILNQNGTITPTEYYTYLKNSAANVYGDSISASASNDTSASASASNDTSASASASNDTSASDSDSDSTDEN